MTLQDRRLEELWTRHLSGEILTEAEEHDLLEAATGDQALRAAIVADDSVHHAVSSLMRSAKDEAAFVRAVSQRLQKTVPPVRSRRVGWIVAVVAPLALAAGIAMSFRLRGARDVEGRHQAPVAVGQEPVVPGPAIAGSARASIAAVSGEAFILGLAGKIPARAGNTLSQGETLVTGGGTSQATLVVPGAGPVEVAADTSLLTIVDVDAPTAVPVLFVTHGTIRVLPAIGAQRSSLRVQTPHATATAQNAAWSLKVEGGKTRLDVVAGQVSFRSNRSASPVAVSSGRYALSTDDSEVGAVPPSATRRVLFIIGDDPPQASDLILIKRIESLNFQVQVRKAGNPGLDGEARGSALVAISSSVESETPELLFRDLPVPIVVWEPALYDDLGMIGPRDPGIPAAAPGAVMVMKETAHPLAAGLTGRVRVSSLPKHFLSQGTPAPTAHWIAAMPDDPTRAAIFGYEQGAPMVDLPAPARRVGLFVNDLSPEHMTEQGWFLFDAAIRWAAQVR